ncbi:MAG: type II secretion system protein GspG [Patescibacteria group bacterium]
MNIGFTTPREKEHKNQFLCSSNAGGANSRQSRGFTLIELMVVIALLGLLASMVLVFLSDAQRDAKDKRRVADIHQIQKALELYSVDHGTYPKESEGANGNVTTNTTFQNLMEPYLNATPRDPINNGTFYYYYDGLHRCGNKDYAVIFARQMEDAANSNYDTFSTVQCSGTVDGEGRGGGAESYNIAVGYSGG